MNNGGNNTLANQSGQRIINFLFIIVVFFVTRQVPLSFLSPIMNLALVLMILLSFIYKKIDKHSMYLVLLLLVFPLTYNLFYSIVFTDNQIALIVKFYLILLFVGLAYFVHVDKKTLKVFIQLCLLQVFVIIGIFIYVSVFFDGKTYLPVRLFFQTMGWGDVYTYDGFFYRIQIKGSALLVIAFIINLEERLFKRNYLVALCLLAGIIFAGNFAFIIGTAIYLIYKMLSAKGVKSVNFYLTKLLFFIIILLVLAPFAYKYVLDTLEIKSTDSLGTRYDQYYFLTQDLFKNQFTLLLGQGLGNTLDVKSAFRDYSNEAYYELQSLYILNQLGLIFFTLFLTYNILIVLKKWGTKNLTVYFFYLIYITYAITNPYIFDTNHVVVIVVLNSWLALNSKQGYVRQPQLQYTRYYII